MNRHQTIESRYDAIVVGARVAGAATAMLLARSGLRVLAVEKTAYGSDTTSTHALMRAGVMQLHRWGVLDRIVAMGTPAIRKTTFHYEDAEIEIPIKERDGVNALYAPRRTVLDVALVDAARDAGAIVRHRARVEGILRDASGRISGVTITDGAGLSHPIEAGIAIGADGAGSAVARAVRAETLGEGKRPAAFLYCYLRGLALNGTHWYFGRDVAAGAIPTNGRMACVFAAMRPGRYEAMRSKGLDALFKQVLTETDEDLARAVVRAEPIGKPHPFAGRPGFMRKSWGPGWALVGDAGCFKDPLTAHGMTDALRDAELLANAVVAGTDDALMDYQASRDAFAVDFLHLSDEIASFDWDRYQIKGLHDRLSRLMGQECEMIRSFETDVAARAIRPEVLSVPA